MLPLIPGMALAIGGAMVLKKVLGFRNQEEIIGNSKSEVLAEVNTYLNGKKSKWRLESIEKIKGGKWKAIISKPA